MLVVDSCTSPRSPLYLLTDSAASDFPASSPPYDSVVVGLAPDQLNYQNLNEAFRLLSPEEKGTKDVPLVVTHKAKYFRDKDGGLSLGPGPFITGLEEASGVEAEVGTQYSSMRNRIKWTHDSIVAALRLIPIPRIAQLASRPRRSTSSRSTRSSPRLRTAKSA